MNANSSVVLACIVAAAAVSFTAGTQMTGSTINIESTDDLRDIINDLAIDIDTRRDLNLVLGELYAEMKESDTYIDYHGMTMLLGPDERAIILEPNAPDDRYNAGHSVAQGLYGFSQNFVNGDQNISAD